MNEQTDSTLQDQLLKILFAEGLGEGLANIAQLLMNAAMLIERENHIGADPYQRAVQRNGHANTAPSSTTTDSNKNTSPRTPHNKTDSANTSSKPSKKNLPGATASNPSNTPDSNSAHGSIATTITDPTKPSNTYLK